jgi:hypothetical protein
MSRAYRISVKESLSRHVQVEDGICSSLELLPILEKERMRELLAAELIRKGYEREGSLARLREEGGLAIEVELETGEVRVTSEGHAELNLTTERTTVVDQAVGSEREGELRELARHDLEQNANEEEAALRKQVTEKLEGRLRDLKDELDGVVNKVTAAALKQRASELGQVEEIHEEANGSLTIKIRV